MPENEGPSRGREAFIPSAWRAFYEETGVPAAVRSGRTLYVTGHTGEAADGVFPTDVEAQVRGTFTKHEDRHAGRSHQWLPAGLRWPQPNVRRIEASRMTFVYAERAMKSGVHLTTMRWAC